jgi:hypothetical protein
MAGFQTIFDIQQKMEVNNRRTTGIQVARSGYTTTADYLTAVPFVFTVTPHAYLYYPQVRDIIQSIDNSDRTIPQTITFSSANLQWFTKMQGTATSAVLATTPPANAQIISVTSNGTFKAGDFIQIGNYPYKVTADSSGSSLSLHRPIIGTPSAGTTLTLGKNVTFRVIAEKCPTYKLNPMTDGAFVEWSEDFVFREYITG